MAAWVNKALADSWRRSGGRDDEAPRVRLRAADAPANAAPLDQAQAARLRRSAEDVCAICVESLAEQTAMPVRLTCNHVFHQHCFDEWRSRQQRDGRQGRCPICRQDADYHGQAGDEYGYEGRHAAELRQAAELRAERKVKAREARADRDFQNDATPAKTATTTSTIPFAGPGRLLAEQDPALLTLPAAPPAQVRDRAAVPSEADLERQRRKEVKEAATREKARLLARIDADRGRGPSLAAELAKARREREGAGR